MSQSDIGAYRIERRLGESLHSEVFLVSHSTLDQPKSVLRLIKPDRHSPALIEALELQIQHLNSLHLPSTYVPELVRAKHNELCLVRPFIESSPLSQVPARPRSLTSSLKLVRAIALKLQELHDAGHVHKAIKPSNILVDAKEGIHLIDDVQVLDINELSHFIYDPSYCRNTLPYISPEQTGRIKFSTDYTTDLYSLGAVFFELIFGHPPFVSQDPLELIHSHLAEPLSMPVASVKAAPETVRKILALLLQKPREKRYQTARGLARDLQICLDALASTGEIPKFELRSEDYSNRITIPSLMVGRATQKTLLLDEFERVCKGEFRSAFVSGFSGIGKTRLIQELQLPIVAAHGYYASGKFDQYQKHVPYSTLIQAIRGLMRVFLTESHKRLAETSTRLTTALAGNGRLVTNILPELELIIGPQPEPLPLPPVEARNRFHHVLGKFLSALPTAKHPLTLFIDDLQWCDGATFEVLELILADPKEFPYLFLIGAYRHNEVDANHRLSRSLQKLDAQAYLDLRLSPLDQADVNEMTAYILNSWPAKTRALSEVIYKTSDGNPLFVNESIRWLHNFGHLELGPDGVWMWDDDKVRHSEIPSSALELFRDKIGRLAPRERELILVAACLGARFDAEDLANSEGMTVSALLMELRSAFAQNLLQAEKGVISFFHDQVQAAAESLIPADWKGPIHAKLATTLIARVPSDAALEELENIFAIVEHLRNGRPAVLDEKWRKTEALYNFHAGVRATASLAMENAYHFFDTALSLLADASWEESYELLHATHMYLARAAMVVGKQTRSDALLETVLSHSTDDLDRADCLYQQTAGLSSMGLFGKAIERGNQGLDVFRRGIPSDDDEALKRSAELLREVLSQTEDPWSHILNVEPSNDRSTRIETAIYSELIPDYYLAGMVPQLYLSAIQSTENCMAGGESTNPSSTGSPWSACTCKGRTSTSSPSASKTWAWRLPNAIRIRLARPRASTEFCGRTCTTGVTPTTSSSSAFRTSSAGNLAVTCTTPACLTAL